MKARTEKDARSTRTAELKDARRRQRCETNESRRLKHGDDEPPDPQGACAPETEVQGSE